MMEYVDGPRYGIMRSEAALNKADGDPYGIEIEYYDKVSKMQGSVKMMVHQIPVELLEPLNEALNKIVAHGLTTAQDAVSG